MENEFPANSHAKKTPTKRETSDKNIKPVVTGNVVRRKTSLGKRFSHTFLGGDAKGVLNYVVMDVLVPAAKDMVTDAVSQGVERMVFGEVRSANRPSARRPGGANGYTTYTNRYAPGSPLGRAGARDEPRTPRRAAARTASHEFDDIILATRVEAEAVMDRLFDLVSQYEQATVADLYELVGLAGSYTDNKWGWTDLRGVGATQVRGGYLLDLPRPEPLE